MFAEQGDRIGDTALLDRVTVGVPDGRPPTEAEYDVERRNILDAGTALIPLVRVLSLVECGGAFKGKSCGVSRVSQSLPNSGVGVLEDHGRPGRRLQNPGNLDKCLGHDLSVLVDALASCRIPQRSVHNSFRGSRRQLVE